MRKEMAFTNIDIEKGNISFTYKITGDEFPEQSGELYFKLTPAIRPANDLIALAMTTVCFKGYDVIRFEGLGISPETQKKIEAGTGACVFASGIEENGTHFSTKRENSILSFSGGFDSLATRALMPENTRLVSMDYGGRFSRERAFFEKFDTCIVETNITQTPLRSNNWSFMGIAAILFSDYLGARYYSFGSVLESSVEDFLDDIHWNAVCSFPLFAAAGMENAPYVLGLTGVATLNIAAARYPELFAQSLTSLANPGEEKRYRKQLMTQIAQKRFGYDLNIPVVPPPARQHYSFGQNFEVDFLALYTIKYAGIEEASHTIKGIPEEAERFVSQLDLRFYDRVNTNYLWCLPGELQSEYLKKLSELEVQPYTKNDWDEFVAVREYLCNYNATLKQKCVEANCWRNMYSSLAVKENHRLTAENRKLLEENALARAGLEKKENEILRLQNEAKKSASQIALMEDKNRVLQKKYHALASSKLGKMTLWYWNKKK